MNLLLFKTAFVMFSVILGEDLIILYILMISLLQLLVFLDINKSSNYLNFFYQKLINSQVVLTTWTTLMLIFAYTHMNFIDLQFYDNKLLFLYLFSEYDIYFYSMWTSNPLFQPIPTPFRLYFFLPPYNMKKNYYNLIILKILLIYFSQISY